MQRGEHPIECVSGSSCCLYITQGFTEPQRVTALKQPAVRTHTCRATAVVETDAAYLTLLALPLSLRLPTPSAAPLLQRLLGRAA